MRYIYCIYWDANFCPENKTYDILANAYVKNINNYFVAKKEWKKICNEIKAKHQKELKIEEDSGNTISMDLLRFKVPNDFNEKQDNVWDCCGDDYKTLEIGILCGGY